MRIFLVRHGMSQSNEDWGVNTRMADHAIELTDKGKVQARAAGQALAGYFEDHLLGDHGPPRIRIWNSPYKRTRQTRDGIMDTCVRSNGDSWFLDSKEHFLLHEQQFGIFDGLSDAEREAQYPTETAYYEKCKRFEGRIWAKLPMGESRIDVAQRMHQAFGTFKRDEERHGIDTIVVVGHGTTNRCFVMAWLHLTPEWLEAEPNPRNCSVRLIEHGVDRGYVFDGFEEPPGYKHAVNKETEE